MPKKFRPLFCGAVLCSFVLFSTGCRTTTTKLSGVPGLGWLDRGEEGWAGYEPAPSLPTPSSKSEPTMNDAKGVSSIASKTSGQSTTSSNPFSRASSSTSLASRTPQSNASKASATKSPSDLKKNGASSYGDYASAYGKYGPPKSLGSPQSVKAQQGPYDVAVKPNYANPRPGASTQGYGSFNATPKNDVAGTSDRGSRFESPGEPSENAAAGARPSENRFASTDSTYRPPGFITKPQPTAQTPNASTRFSAAPASSRFATPPTGRTPEFVASAPASATAGTATSRAADLEDRISAAAGTESKSFLGSRFGGATPSATPSAGSGSEFRAANPAKSTNPFAAPITAPTTSPQAQLQNLGRDAAGAISQSARTTSSDISSSAKTFGSDVTRVTKDSTSNALGVAGQTANGYLDTVRNKAAEAGQSAGDYLKSAEQAGSQLLQNGSTGGRYPSTNTPNGYLDSLTPPTKSPGTTAPPSTIRRSATPFRPGSTSSFQSSMHTAKKHEVTLASTNEASRAQLVLAVGDKFQFPRTLR